MMQRTTLTVVALLTLALPGVVETAGTFVRISDMTTARRFSTAIPLPGGKVLIVGGDPDATMELYDPGVSGGGAFTRVDFNMGGKLLSVTPIDGGRVLLLAAPAGTPSNQVPSSVFAIVFDPAQGTATLGGSMVEPQLPPAGILLRNGKVLFAGGVAAIFPTSDPNRLAIPELYDLATGTFSFTGPFATTGCTPYVCGGPYVSTVSLLADGRVLIAGEPNSEIYDPAAATFSLTGRMVTPCVFGFVPLYITGRTATLLSNGKVLLTGGHHEDCGRFANAELYDPGSGTFTATGDMTRPRDNHGASLLSNGTVLITGGETQDCVANFCLFSGTTTSAELYDPSTGRFTLIGTMNDRRAGHTSTLLQNGSVLITGGYCYAGIGQICGTFATAEVYTPTSTPWTDSTLTPGVTSIKKVHIDELRARIDAVRTARGLSVFEWTDSPLVAETTTIKAIHIEELRTALNQVYAAAGRRTLPTYTDPSLTAGITSIKAIHISELRAAIEAVE